MRFLFRFVAACAAAVIAGLSMPAAIGAQSDAARGWVGVAYTTSVGETDRNGVMVFSDYPVIESIEPGSPAQKAGLEAGDVILAMNSQDLRRDPLPLGSMLKPGNRIVFRVKRNDALREITVVVVPRPAGTAERLAFTLVEPVPRPPAGPRSAAPRTPQSVSAQPSSFSERTPAPRAVPPMVALAPLTFGFGSSTLGVAGAELTRLDSELAELVGTQPPGVFVVKVAPGTPAGVAGLRSGDVIVAAGRNAIGIPGELIRIMERDGSPLQLRIVRKRKSQTVTLSW